MQDNKENKEIIQIPEGSFCSGNCAEPRECYFWNPQRRDSNGRQYCSHYDSYYYPYERNGCLSKKD